MLKKHRLIVKPVLVDTTYVDLYDKSQILGLIEEGIALSVSMEIPVRINIATKNGTTVPIDVQADSDKDQVYAEYEQNISDWFHGAI